MQITSESTRPKLGEAFVLPEVENKHGLLYLPYQKKDVQANIIGKVIRLTSDKTMAQLGFKVDDRVVFSPFEGSQIKGSDGEDWFVVPIKDIICTVED